MATGSWTGLRARKVLEQLRPRMEIPQDEPLEVWGPLEAYQYDASGHVRIQQYLTVLVRRNAENWLFVQQVNAINNGHPWPSPPLILPTSQHEAERWLAQNNFSSTPRSPSMLRASASQLRAILPWF